MFVPYVDVIYMVYVILFVISPGLYKLERRLAFFNNAQLQTQSKADLICRTLNIRIQVERTVNHTGILRLIQGSQQVPVKGVSRCEQVIAPPAHP